MAITYKVKAGIKNNGVLLRRILSKFLFLKETEEQKNHCHKRGISSQSSDFYKTKTASLNVIGHVHLLKPLQDLKFYCRPLSRFYGEQSHYLLNIFRVPFLLLNGVHEHNPVCLYLGDLGNKLKYIREDFLHRLSTSYVLNPLIGYDSCKKLYCSISTSCYKKLSKILHSFLCMVAQRTPNHIGHNFLIA